MEHEAIAALKLPRSISRSCDQPQIRPHEVEGKLPAIYHLPTEENRLGAHMGLDHALSAWLR